MLSQTMLTVVRRDMIVVRATQDKPLSGRGSPFCCINLTPTKKLGQSIQYHEDEEELKIGSTYFAL